MRSLIRTDVMRTERVYGELGTYTRYVNIYVRMIKYWFKMLITIKKILL